MRDLLNGYFDTVKVFSEESKILQKFIISLAVQGKLNNKKSNSGSAKNLLNEIKKEKEFLIKKGEKVLLSSFDQKHLIPFKIPTNWEWSSLGEICSYIQRGKSPKYALDGSKVISQKCIQWSGLDLSVAKFIENESLVKYKKEQFLKVGDLLWNSTGTGTIGRVLKVNNLEEKLVCDSHVTILRCLKVNPDFVKIWLMSDFVYGLIEEKATGSTNQIELTKTIAIQQCVPIPPLIEQNIIVEKVEELMRHCIQQEKKQNKCIETHNTLVTNLLSRLTSTQTDATKFTETWQIIQTNFDTLFTNKKNIDQLKQTILKLAFTGNLVSQDQKDKPSKDLLEQIKKKKEIMIKEGLFKNCKSFPPITDKEQPYQVPASWEWIHLPEVYYSISPAKKKIKTSNIQISGKYPVVDQGREYISGFSDDRKLVIKVSEPLIIFGDHTRNIKYIDFDFIPGADGTKILCPLLIYPRYFYFYLLHFELKGKGYARHFKILNKNLIAIPPLPEQIRIVAKIEELMALCDQLKSKITQSETTQRNLACSFVEEAIR